MHDVVLYEVFEEEAIALRKHLSPDLKVEIVSGLVSETSESCPAPFISIRTQSLIPVNWLPQMKGILTRSTGYEHLLPYVNKTNGRVLCGYLPEYCARAVAEQAFLMAMSLLRKLPLQIEKFRDFDRDGLTGRECAGKKMLVVGVGKIGTHLVDIGRGMGMEVKGVDIAPKRDDVEYVELENGIAWAQVVFCAVPLTTETEGMFNYALFQKSKNQVVFINVARGESSPLMDLKRLLDEGFLAGLGMDVYDDEGRLAESLRQKRPHPQVPLLEELGQRQNVIFTPHNAFNTEEALERKAQKSAESIEAFVRNGTFPNPIPLTAKKG